MKGKVHAGIIDFARPLSSREEKAVEIRGCKKLAFLRARAFKLL